MPYVPKRREQNNMMQTSKKYWGRTMIALVLAGLVLGCETKTAVRGNLPTPSQLQAVKVGESTRSDVVKLLGNPSTRGTFDSQTWYYISRQTEQWAFLSPEVTDQQVVAIYFNDRGKVQHIEHYQLADGRDVQPVDRKTATTGHELGFWEQMFGNLGILPGKSAR
jgi:outer membrane protein assembly factor BamE (lipoprotein component of BamABCDE complex)